MVIASQQRLTFVPPSGDPLVILDYGKDTTEEFSYPWKQQTQKGNPFGSFGINYARGDVTNTFNVTTVEKHATNIAAKLWGLELNVILNAYSEVTGVFKVETQGETDWFELASATIDDAVPRSDLSAGARTFTGWQISGCGWSKVSP